MTNPSIAALAMDNRLIVIARRLLGEKAIPFRATLFDKSPKANWLVGWHQDTALPLTSHVDEPGWGPWSNKVGISYARAPAWALSRIVALRVHLDESTAENGPLRVLSNSHLLGVLKKDEALRYARGRAYVECLVARGGVLAMRPLVIHSSSKARSDIPRRILHIEYADSLELSPRVHLALA